MIACSADHADALVVQPANLLKQKALRLEGQSVAVEEVSSDQKRVHVLTNREVDSIPERLTRGFAESGSHLFGSAREGRFEVDVGDVQETHRAN